MLAKLPCIQDPNFLVGFDHSDDAAVYKLTDELAMVQTLDFFPPMVEDPYVFGQVAAANALSDIYAMGAVPKTALNIVCFPAKLDMGILDQILRGGSEKVMEAGAVLAGGHSIDDVDVKYGLSVTGLVDPRKIYTNIGCRAGDVLILTKPLGVGIVCSADRVGEASEDAMTHAVKSMITLNKYAAEVLGRYPVHALTDVTGFGFLGHLHEMLAGQVSAIVVSGQVPHIPQALHYAEEFLITGAAQRNRNFLEDYVQIEPGVSFGLEELLFDPQTSGGLLASVPARVAKELVAELEQLGLPCGIVGEIIPRVEKEIMVR